MSLLELIVSGLEDKKANDITVIDFENRSSLCDAFVVCDAQSLRQVNAIAQDLENMIQKAGFEIKPQKNTPESQWVVIDAVDVVVHIFQTEERHRYHLEKLYQEFIRD